MTYVYISIGAAQSIEEFLQPAIVKRVMTMYRQIVCMDGWQSGYLLC